MTACAWDGFDTYNGMGANTGVSVRWGATNIPGDFTLVTGRFGGQAIQATTSRSAPASTSTRQRTFTAARSSGANAIAIKIDVLTSLQAQPFIMLLAAGLPQFGIGVNANGSIALYRCGATVNTAAAATLATSTAIGLIVAGNYQHLSWTWLVSATVGTFTLWLDGVAVTGLNGLTGLNNKGQAATTCDGIAACTILGGTCGYDDYAEGDATTQIIESRVETCYATSDVAQGFTRSTGATNYTLVDEAQVNGDTDYVQASAVGTVDTYGFGNLSSTPTTVIGVQFVCFAEKTDATSRSIALQAVSGATTSDGANFALSANYQRLERQMVLDPNGSIAWVGSAVDALTGGPKVTV